MIWKDVPLILEEEIIELGIATPARIKGSLHLQYMISELFHEDYVSSAL